MCSLTVVYVFFTGNEALDVKVQDTVLGYSYMYSEFSRVWKKDWINEEVGCYKLHYSMAYSPYSLKGQQ